MYARRAIKGPKKQCRSLHDCDKILKILISSVGTSTGEKINWITRFSTNVARQRKAQRKLKVNNEAEKNIYRYTWMAEDGKG